MSKKRNKSENELSKDKELKKLFEKEDNNIKNHERPKIPSRPQIKKIIKPQVQNKLNTMGIKDFKIGSIVARCKNCGKLKEIFIQKTALCYKCYQESMNEERKGFYIYKFYNTKNEIIYIGSTTDMYHRISNHMTGNSNINCNYTDWVLKSFNRIDYIDIHKDLFSYDSNLNEESNYETARKELYYIEYYLTNKYKPKLNKNDINVEDITPERKKELEIIEQSQKYQEYQLTKNQKEQLKKAKESI